MTNEQKLIDKCNRMAMIIGQSYAVIAQQYNEAPSHGLKQCINNLQNFIEKEFYPDKND